MIWIHATKDVIEAALTDFRSVAESKRPGAVLSINWNRNQTEGLVKLPDVTAKDMDKKPWWGQAIRVYTEADHAETLTMVNDAEWIGLDAE